MPELLTVKGTVSTAPCDCDFVEIYSKSYLKITRHHLFPVRIGVTDEQWAVRPYPDAPRPKQIEYDEFFDFGENEWDLEKTVLLGGADIVLINGRRLEAPKSV